MRFKKNEMPPDPRPQQIAACEAAIRKMFQVVEVRVLPFGAGLSFNYLPAIAIQWLAAFDGFADADAYARASGKTVTIMLNHGSYAPVSVPVKP